MWRIVAVAVAATVLVFSAPGGQRPVGAAVVPLTLQDLVNQSSICVRGVVVSADAAWTESGAMIETTYTVQRLETLMGAAPDTVEVKVPGGDLDGIRIRNGEAPSYALGEEVVCFLNPTAADDWTTFGWFQGKYTVLGGWMRELSATSYDTFRAQILAAVANK